MTGEMPSLEKYVEASSSLLGFSMEPDWKDSVRVNLETIFKIAALIEGFQLPDEIEPAAVFEA